MPIVRLELPALINFCDVIRFANRVSLLADVPLGVESAPGLGPEPCTERPTPGVTTGPPTTARMVLDRLVSMAPDYAWRDMNGVVVVRPVAAWNSPDHFLGARVQSFDGTDANMAEAFAALSQPLAPRGFWPESAAWAAAPPGRASFSLSFPGGSLLDALNAIVRPRGDLGWTIHYCGERATREAATVALRIHHPPSKTVRVIFAYDPYRPTDPCRAQ